MLKIIDMHALIKLLPSIIIIIIIIIIIRDVLTGTFSINNNLFQFFIVLIYFL